MKRILNFLFRQSLDERFPTDLVNIKNQQHYQFIERELLKDDDHIIFLIGPWGSGKSVCIRTLANENKKVVYVTILNLFGIHSVDDAIAYTIGVTSRAISFLTLCLIIFSMFRVSNHYSLLEIDFDNLNTLQEIAIPALISLFLSYVVGWKSRFILLFSLLPRYMGSILIRCGRKQIYVIEDLDRSSMEISDRFRFLIDLPPIGGRYLVTYGYSNDEERVKLIEQISKINGISINLDQNQAVVHEILKQNIQYLPFNSAGIWMEEIPLRLHLNLYFDCERINKGKTEDFKRVWLLKNYIELLANFKIIHPDLRDATDLNLVFNGNFNLKTNYQLNVREGHLIRSFGNSIDATYFQILLSSVVPPNDKTSVNWQEIAWQKMLGHFQYL